MYNMQMIVEHITAELFRQGAIAFVNMEYGIATLRKVLENKAVCLNGRCYDIAPGDTLPEKIYKLRKQNRLSRDKFANMANLAVKTVRDWEIGTVAPTKTSLEKVCSAFGVDIAYFI
jgi:DNA-binding transcriptional regulator YiaG